MGVPVHDAVRNDHSRAILRKRGGLPILCASEQDVPTLLQLPLQQKHVADNPFAVIPVIGVWSAISVVAGACNHRNRPGQLSKFDIPYLPIRLDRVAEASHSP